MYGKNLGNLADDFLFLSEQTNAVLCIRDEIFRFANRRFEQHIRLNAKKEECGYDMVFISSSIPHIFYDIWFERGRNRFYRDNVFIVGKMFEKEVELLPSVYLAAWKDERNEDAIHAIFPVLTCALQGEKDFYLIITVSDSTGSIRIMQGLVSDYVRHEYIGRCKRDGVGHFSEESVVIEMKRQSSFSHLGKAFLRAIKEEILKYT